MSEYENTLGVNVALSELRRVERERDEARAEVERMRTKKCRLMEERGKAERERDEARAEVERARREGAEAMREAAAQRALWVGLFSLAEDIRALPLPGDEKTEKEKG